MPHTWIVVDGLALYFDRNKITVPFGGLPRRLGIAGPVGRAAGAVAQGSVTSRETVRQAQETTYETTVIDSLAGLRELETAWTRLQDAPHSLATAFQAFEDTLILAEGLLAANPDHRLHVVVIAPAGGAPVLILPMVMETHFGTRIARWLGSPLVQFGDAICAAPPEDAVVAAALAAKGRHGKPDFFDFRNIRADAAIRPWLDRNGHATGIIAESPHVDLPAGADAATAFAHVRSKAKRERRRKLRKLAEFGDVEFEVLDAGADTAKVMAVALDFKRQWLEANGLVSRALSEAWVRAALVEMAARSRNTKISVLTVAGDIAAVEVGFARQDRYFAFMGAINPAHAHASPGDVQTERTLLWLSLIHI